MILMIICFFGVIIDTYHNLPDSIVSRIKVSVVSSFNTTGEESPPASVSSIKIRKIPSS